MYRSRKVLGIALAALGSVFVALCGAPAHAHADDVGEVDAAGTAPHAADDSVAGGAHWRVSSSRGVVHVWVPAGYEPATAGVVLYVHGYRITADGAWSEHHLAQQFAASGRNALFVVPAAPENKHRSVRFEDIGALLREIRQHTGLERPWGPVVAIGHSGAYRTIATWLDEPELEHIMLLDGLYGNESEFRDWLESPGQDPDQGDHGGARPMHRWTMVVMDTVNTADPWVRDIGDAYILDWIPERIEDVDATARAARLLYVYSQYGHVEIVAESTAIAVLLQTTRLASRRSP